MQHLDSILIPAHHSITLEPGSYHLMMPAPESRLVEGDRVPLLLHFGNEHPVHVEAEVKKNP
jgi:copper(I)-binding protein